MSALSYPQWWGGTALLIGGTGNGKDRKAEEKRWEKRWEREESKKGGYGLEIAVCTQGMHELVKK